MLSETRMGSFEKYMRRIEFPISKVDMLWAVENLKPYNHYEWFMVSLRDSIVQDEKLVFDASDTLAGKPVEKMPEDWESFYDYAL